MMAFDAANRNTRVSPVMYAVEDWPYMPAHRGSFCLVPTSFFARNPTLDVPATGRRSPVP
jgi:Cu2+-containing amine oxidase